MTDTSAHPSPAACPACASVNDVAEDISTMPAAFSAAIFSA